MEPSIDLNEVKSLKSKYGIGSYAALEYVRATKAYETLAEEVNQKLTSCGYTHRVSTKDVLRFCTLFYEVSGHLQEREFFAKEDDSDSEQGARVHYHTWNGFHEEENTDHIYATKMAARMYFSRLASGQIVKPFKITNICDIAKTVLESSATPNMDVLVELLMEPDDMRQYLLGESTIILVENTYAPSRFYRSAREQILGRLEEQQQIALHFIINNLEEILILHSPKSKYDVVDAAARLMRQEIRMLKVDNSAEEKFKQSQDAEIEKYDYIAGGIDEADLKYTQLIIAEKSLEELIGAAHNDSGLWYEIDFASQYGIRRGEYILKAIEENRNWLSKELPKYFKDE